MEERMQQEIPQEEQLCPETAAAETPAPAEVEPEEWKRAAPLTEVKKPAAKAARKKRGFFRTLLAILLCAVLFALSAAAVLVLGAREFATAENLKNTVSQAVSGLDTIPAAVIVEEAESGDTVMDVIVDAAAESGVALEKEAVEAYLNDSRLVDEMVGKLAGSITGAEGGSLSREDLMGLLEEDRELLGEVVGAEVSDGDLAIIADVVEDSGLLEATDVETMSEEMTPVYEGVQLALSNEVLYALFGAAAVLVLLLWAVNRWNLSRTSGDVGITLALSGGLLLLVLTAVPAAVSVFLEDAAIGTMVDALGSLVIAGWLSAARAVAVAGVALIVVSFVLWLIRKGRAGKAA